VLRRLAGLRIPIVRALLPSSTGSRPAIALENGVYRITEQGTGYFDGEYGAEDGGWMQNGDDNGTPSAGEQPGEI
jgi:hypothetical protein